MSPRYAVLAGRIRQELDGVARTVARARRHADVAKLRPDDDAYVDSVALNLHDFYSGLERIFQRIAADLDESTPRGDSWHRELLEQMSTEVKSVRPAVLSRDDVAALEEYLRFRHVVRSIYAYELRPERVARLSERLEDVFAAVKGRLGEFADYLDRLSAE